MAQPSQQAIDGGLSGATTLALRQFTLNKVGEAGWIRVHALLPPSLAERFLDEELGYDASLPTHGMADMLHAIGTVTGETDAQLMYQFGEHVVPWIAERAGFKQAIHRMSPTFIGFARCFNQLLLQMYTSLCNRKPSMPEAQLTEVKADSFLVGIFTTEETQARSAGLLALYQGMFAWGASALYGIHLKFDAPQIAKLLTGQLYHSCRVSFPPEPLDSLAWPDVNPSSSQPQTQACPDDTLGLDPSSFYRLFPFHFMLDSTSLRVLQAGPALRRTLPALVPGVHVADVLVVRVPRVQWSVDCLQCILENDMSVKVMLSSTCGLDLCGGLHRVKLSKRKGGGGELAEAEEALVFLGLPYVNSVDEMERLGVYVSDFPPHDMAVDHMLMAASKQVQAAEVLREAEAEKTALRTTLAETLATQQENASRSNLQIDTAGQVLLSLLNSLVLGEEVSVQQALSARNTLLQSGNNVWKPIEVDWSHVDVGDKEVNDALAKLLGTPGIPESPDPERTTSSFTGMDSINTEGSSASLHSKALMLASFRSRKLPTPQGSGTIHTPRRARSRSLDEVHVTRLAAGRTVARDSSNLSHPGTPHAPRQLPQRQSAGLEEHTSQEVQDAPPAPRRAEARSQDGSGNTISSLKSFLKSMSKVFKPSRRTSKSGKIAAKPAASSKQTGDPSAPSSAEVPAPVDKETVAPLPVNTTFNALALSRPFASSEPQHSALMLEPLPQLHTNPLAQASEPLPAPLTFSTRPIVAVGGRSSFTTAAMTTTPPWQRKLPPQRQQRPDSGKASFDVNPAVVDLVRQPNDEMMKVLGSVDEWQFDSFALDRASGGRPLSCLAYCLMERSGVIKQLRLNGTKLARFLTRCEEGYGDNPYHGKIHAADVLRSFHVILTRGGVLATIAKRSSEPTAVQSLEGGGEDKAQQLLTCYLAAVVHDFEHRGVNNDFLIRSHDPLALRYNDMSPMEMHHLAAAFTLMHDRDYAFMPAAGKQFKAQMRKDVIELVLATDMKQHFALNSSFAHKISQPVLLSDRAGVMPGSPNGDGASRPRRAVHASSTMTSSVLQISSGQAALTWDRDTEMLALKMTLKAADLGHLTSGTEVHKQWVKRLEEELFLQGDREKAIGQLVSPLMDRSKAGITKSQCGFFTVVAQPMYQGFVQAFPGAKMLLANLENNLQYWKAAEAAAQATEASSKA